MAINDDRLELTLAGRIDADATEVHVLSTKVEITLKKDPAGVSWPALAGTAAAPVVQSASSAPPSEAPRPRSKWDSLAIEDEQPAADTEINAFFQKLYADADPDTRRAMIKSFQESNGTALSTNWDEVGRQKTRTQPPAGMEARRYEQ